jgi:hypothetical protein
MIHGHVELVGERVRLCRAVTADAQDRVAIGRHPEILRMYGSDNAKPAPYALEQCLAWVEGMAADPLAWVVEDKGHIFMGALAS